MFITRYKFCNFVTYNKFSQLFLITINVNRQDAEFTVITVSVDTVLFTVDLISESYWSNSTNNYYFLEIIFLIFLEIQQLSAELCHKWSVLDWATTPVHHAYTEQLKTVYLLWIYNFLVIDWALLIYFWLCFLHWTLYIISLRSTVPF